jgi:SAM-dependent methyltransferase
VRKYPNIRKSLSFLQHTPLHPQWFVFRKDIANLEQVAEIATGRVLDIGCAYQRIRQFLKGQANYIGLDYYRTAKMWYGSRPTVHGDAQELPFLSQSFDAVVLLDVLEHLPYPDKCISEIERVLKPRGIFILQVPYLYPTHDSPLDFHRWTIQGLYRLVKDYGFEIRETNVFGRPLETAALLTNIAICRNFLELVKNQSVFSIFFFISLFLILPINLAAFIISSISGADDMMPYGHRVICIKEK